MQKPVAELAESPEVITQKPAFVVFMEGGDKEEQVINGQQGNPRRTIFIPRVVASTAGKSSRRTDRAVSKRARADVCGPLTVGLQ